MAVRVLRCAIEQIVDWHAHLFVEPQVVAFVAVAGQYSIAPAQFRVACTNIASRRVGGDGQLHLAVTWHKDTAEQASRLRATMHSGPLVEMASIALALILVHRVVPLGRLDVTDYGARADYRSRERKTMVEVSGTEVAAELGRRHREKIAQALENPFGWDAYVVVCAFTDTGHRIHFGKHSKRGV